MAQTSTGVTFLKAAQQRLGRANIRNTQFLWRKVCVFRYCPEIGKLRFARKVYEDVGQGDVAMHYAEPVEVAHRCHHGETYLLWPSNRIEMIIRGWVANPDILPEGSATSLHGYIKIALLLASANPHAHHLQEVRVREALEHVVTCRLSANRRAFLCPAA